MNFKNISTTILMLFVFSGLTACDRVKPGQLGVLVQNYGKNPSEDYSVVSGKVITAAPGTTLYKLPAYEQRNEFEAPIIVKSSDGTQLSIKPRYSYRIDPAQATKVIRQYSGVITNGSDLKEVEKKALDPAITDVVRDIIGRTTSTDIMNTGGNTGFNDQARTQITLAFKERGFILESFSTVLDYSESVKASIDARNKANSEINTLDSKIEQARKETELAKLEAVNTITKSEAITEQQIQIELISKWNGQLPATYICNDKSSPLTMMLNSK